MSVPHNPTLPTATPAPPRRRALLRAIAGIAFLLSIVTWGVAQRTALRLDDSDVDYTNHETEEVYPALAFANGELTLSFHDQRSGATLPAIEYIIPDLERLDRWDNEIGAEITDIDELEWSARGFEHVHASTLDGATYTHSHTTVVPIVDAYVQAFTALGFQAEILDTVSAGFKVGTFTHGDHRVRVDFRRAMDGNRVVVELKVL